MWDWYDSLSRSIRRVRDGIAEPIPPSEYAAWVSMTGTIVYPHEYATLQAMDLAFCDETNKELEAYRERQEAARKKG